MKTRDTLILAGLLAVVVGILIAIVVMSSKDASAKKDDKTPAKRREHSTSIAVLAAAGVVLMLSVGGLVVYRATSSASAAKFARADSRVGAALNDIARGVSRSPGPSMPEQLQRFNQMSDSQFPMWDDHSRLPRVGDI
jgi:heme/copper-type cytochrome/quinol oxidase subunit 2